MRIGRQPKPCQKYVKNKVDLETLASGDDVMGTFLTYETEFVFCVCFFSVLAVLENSVLPMGLWQLTRDVKSDDRL